MSTQSSLPFDRDPEPIRFADTKLEPEERPRLGGQCRAILERLRRGRATNRELAGISLKYTGRISDLRKSGYEIVVVSRDRKTGLTWYELRREI
jgi:hypothetical protein